MLLDARFIVLNNGWIKPPARGRYWKCAIDFRYEFI